MLNDHVIALMIAYCERHFSFRTNSHESRFLCSARNFLVFQWSNFSPFTRFSQNSRISHADGTQFTQIAHDRQDPKVHANLSANYVTTV
jgi:hypothetical protein